MDPSLPTFMSDANRLARVAKKLNRDDLKKLMGISDQLADLNVERFKAFKSPHPEGLAKPAALFFAGDTYTGLDAASWSDEDLAHAQSHLGILQACMVC